MSLYKDTSEITKVNRAAGTVPVKVSPEMIEVVEHATKISELSGGVFDVTLDRSWSCGRCAEGREGADGQGDRRGPPLVNYRTSSWTRRRRRSF